ncbi:MAG: nucleoside transporter [Planctomycetes bacterium]|nr:nucleoside transporter [Planctomycetota bacterium]
MLHAISALGLLVFVAVAWLCSERRKATSLRLVAVGLGLQLAIGAALFHAPGIKPLFLAINGLVNALLSASKAGTDFVFGPLAHGPGAADSPGFILATQVLVAAVFFAAVTALLYRLGVIQPVVRAFAWMFRRGLGLSGAEATASAANIFVGVEAALVVRPWLARMTRSELMVLLTSGMATVASTVLGFYVSFFGDRFPELAGHLVGATLLAIPAAIVCAKLIVPETGVPETLGSVTVDERPRGPVMGAVMAGAMDGVRLAVGIAAGLIALLGLVALVDMSLAWAGGRFGMDAPPTLTGLLGALFLPVAWLLGVPQADLIPAAEMLGTRVVATEVPAFLRLADLQAAGAIAPRTLVIMSYALCGFAHIASVAIFVGGTAALAPERRDDLAGLGAKALLAATLATLMSGAVAGIFCRV